MADTQIKGTLSADEAISGFLNANEGINASLTPDGEISGTLEVKRTMSIPTYLNDIADVNIDNPQDGQVMKYNGLTDEWENANDEDSGVWGSITGTLSNQTDLQNALDAKIPSTEKGSNNGVATLDATGRVPSSQLPSYVDDVLEYASLSAFPATGEAGKIYVALDTNKMYRWGGSTYVEVSESLALGETTGTAYEGSKGKANADNISAIQGKIPSNASSSNKMATASDITDINNKIPSNASSSNKLATASDIPVITGKADKVQNATSGHFAGLDANGNLTDSGVTAADMVGVSEELLKDTVGWTGKNLIPYPYYETTITKNGVTFTDNADGTITVDTESSGASAFSQFICHDRYNTEHNEFFIPNGTYILSGCPSGGSSSSYRMGAVITKNGTYKYLGFDTGSSVEVTVNGDDYSNDGAYLGIVIDIASGTITSNKVFKPMLRFASINDATYEPYHKPVSEWAYTRSEANILGAKNFVKFPYSNVSQTKNNITYTINNDGTVLINTGTGGASAGTAFNLISTANADLKDFPEGRLKLSTNINVSSGIWINIVRRLNGTNINQTVTASNTPVEFDWSHAGTVYNGYNCEIYISKNIEVSNLLIKPLVRLATDSDGTYQPYAETNYQLTHNKLSYEDNGVLGAKNLLPYPYTSTTFALNNVTFTDNGDGSVTFVTTNEGASANTTFSCASAGSAYHPKAGRYILSAQGLENLSDASNAKVAIAAFNGNSWVKDIAVLEKGALSSVIDIDYSGYDRVNIYIRVYSGKIITTAVRVYPMLRLATDSDETWQPYAMTNKALTDANKELTDGKVSKTGDTITGTLILSRTTDASGTANSKPALIVGGTDTQLHIEIDSNEIMAKANGTTTSELYLNSDGGLVRINGKIASKFTSRPTDKYVLVADGTEGNIKSISTLPVAQGGTGDTTITANGVMVGNGTSGVKTANSKSGALYSTGDGVMPVFGVLPVAQGGTGHGSNGLTANAVLLGNGTSAFKTIATGSGALYATAANAQPVFGILPVAQGGTGGSTAAAARSGLDVYSKDEVNTNITNLNTAINGKASLAGAKFTGNVDTNGYLYVSNGTTSVGFHSGTHNSTQCVNTTAPIQSNYGALVLASLGSTHVVSIRGKETHIRNNADSAYVKIYASAFDTSSSRRYKENIQDLSDEEAKKLLDVNVVTFDFKKDVGIAEDNDRLNKFGVIAEDVVEICPDVVSFREIDGEMLPDSVDYSKFVPRLIKMVQIQEERINELERRINNEL